MTKTVFIAPSARVRQLECELQLLEQLNVRLKQCLKDKDDMIAFLRR